MTSINIGIFRGNMYIARMFHGFVHSTFIIFVLTFICLFLKADLLGKK